MLPHRKSVILQETVWVRLQLRLRKLLMWDALWAISYMELKDLFERSLMYFKVGDERKEAKVQTMNSYKAAQDIPEVDLAPTYPIRLGLALNFLVFYCEILNSSNKVCSMVKQTFEDAIDELDTLVEYSYKDSTLIMQLLRENLTFWTSNAHDQLEEP
ncbi:hypothetical protein L2E82_35042 [Cichorium intybus]|uniref:Uncharacterized protein n=1 Tax=Cichorium intybus TaxID=13427 RepID=A0ACB9BN38_CICIN|nr:hypothetical protein L2E82_35042 [Cichorium intybus]